MSRVHMPIAARSPSCVRTDAGRFDTVIGRIDAGGGGHVTFGGAIAGGGVGGRGHGGRGGGSGDGGGGGVGGGGGISGGGEGGSGAGGLGGALGGMGGGRGLGGGGAHHGATPVGNAFQFGPVTVHPSAGDELRVRIGVARLGKPELGQVVDPMKSTFASCIVNATAPRGHSVELTGSLDHAAMRMTCVPEVVMMS